MRRFWNLWWPEIIAFAVLAAMLMTLTVVSVLGGRA